MQTLRASVWHVRHFIALLLLVLLDLHALKILRKRGAPQHVQPTLVHVLALGPKEVYVILERQPEHKLLLHGILETGRTHHVAQQRQTRQGALVLMVLVEVQAERREHHPEFLPAGAVLEFAQQIAGHLVLSGEQMVVQRDRRAAMPAHVQRVVAPRLRQFGGRRRFVAIVRWRVSGVQTLIG